MYFLELKTVTALKWDRCDLLHIGFLNFHKPVCRKLNASGSQFPTQNITKLYIQLAVLNKERELMSIIIIDSIKKSILVVNFSQLKLCIYIFFILKNFIYVFNEIQSFLCSFPTSNFSYARPTHFSPQLRAYFLNNLLSTVCDINTHMDSCPLECGKLTSVYTFKTEWFFLPRNYTLPRASL